MNSGTFLPRIAVAGFMALSLSAANAADRETRLDYYQKEVKSQKTGIYPHDGDLYLHVKLPYGKGDRSDYKRVEANKQLKEMLRSWAISHAEARLRESEPDSEGMAFAKKIVGKYYPQWNYGAWMFRGAVQSPVPETSDGFYTGGMIVSEKEVVEQIPEGFYRKGSDEDLFKGVRLVVRANMAQAKSAQAFLKECDAGDLCAEGERGEAFKEIDRRVADYLKTSPLAKKMNDSRVKLETPVVTEDCVDEELPAEISESVNVAVSTNTFAAPVVETNTTARMQTVAELKKTGYLKGSQLTEEAVSCAEYETVETKTQTVVTVSRRIHKKVTKTTRGTAVFERVFLNGFAKGDKAAETTKIGEIAIGRISGKAADKSTGRLLKSALQENPYDRELWNHYGKWFAESKDLIAAVICYRRSLFLDPRGEEAMMSLGEAYRRLGYGKLASGLAFVARGLSDDDDIVLRAESVLLGR